MCGYLGHEVPTSPQFPESIRRRMDLFEAHAARATFFLVGKQAQDWPDVVREIVARGHEVASHGWSHAKTDRLSPDVFREDVRRSVGALEDITGAKVRGYRTPFFSLLPSHPWAIEAMLDAGIEYDSSIATLLWQRAGVSVPDQPFVFELGTGASIVEIPIPARRWGPLTVRLIGGRCMRVLPRSVSMRHVRDSEVDGQAAMMYLHSYELPGMPLAAHVPVALGSKRRTLCASALAFQIGLNRMHRLTTHLLRTFGWSTAHDVLADLRRQDRLTTIAFPS